MGSSPWYLLKSFLLYNSYNDVENFNSIFWYCSFHKALEHLLFISHTTVRKQDWNNRVKLTSEQMDSFSVVRSYDAKERKIVSSPKSPYYYSISININFRCSIWSFLSKNSWQKKGGKTSPPCPGKKEPPLILSPLKIEAPQKLAQLF